jgi:hypothetical protein
VLAASIARADGPQTNDVLGQKVIGLRGWPIVPVDPRDGQGLFWSKALGSYAPGGASGVAGNPGGALGSIQINAGGIFGGLVPSSDFSTSGGAFALSNGAACFNIGSLGGDLINTICNNPTLASGAAARNVGVLSNALTGSLPAPGLNLTVLLSTLGAPGGDIGGSSFANMTVTGFNGIPLDPTPPAPNTVYTFNGAIFTPVLFQAGINQITGQLIVGPGSGTQSGSIAPGTVSNAQLISAPAGTLKCNPSAGVAAPQDCTLNSSLAFTSGALGLSPTLGPSQQQTLSDGTTKFCFIITNGVTTSITSGQCTTGSLILTADDGSTQLTADDGSTLLTADGSNPTTPCNSAKYAFNVACNASVWTLFRSAF